MPCSSNSGNIVPQRNDSFYENFPSYKSSLPTNQQTWKHRNNSWKNTIRFGKGMPKPPPNSLPPYATRKSSFGTFPSSTWRRAPPYTNQSEGWRKDHLASRSIDARTKSSTNPIPLEVAGKSPFNTLLSDTIITQAVNSLNSNANALATTAMENEMEIIVIDDDKKLAAETSVPLTRKRGATNDKKVTDNIEMGNKVARLPMDNDDESMPKPPIQMKTHPYKSYVPRNECWHMWIVQQENYFPAMHKFSISLPIVWINMIFHCSYHCQIL